MTQQFICGMIFMLCILVCIDDVIASWVNYIFMTIFISLINGFIIILNTILYPIFWLEYQVTNYFYQKRIEKEVMKVLKQLNEEDTNE